MNQIFVAYPADPRQIGDTIEEAVKLFSRAQKVWTAQTWRQSDIPGRFIVEGVERKILTADIVLADISALNFNVAYEFGYALGRGRLTIPIVNKAYASAQKELDEIGIFDSIGIETYENSGQLEGILRAASARQEFEFHDYEINRRAPLYLLDTLYKTDGIIRLKSRIKKARIQYRSFDPSEQARLSSFTALNEIRQSVAVVVLLLGHHAQGHRANNLRGAFLAGVARSLNKNLLILQEGDEPVPADYRDLVRSFKDPRQIDRHFNDFAPEVTQALQEIEGRPPPKDERLIASLDLGAPAAENEMNELGSYYVATDEFSKVLRGMARLAVGRKGSGKTALFFQIRDRIRKDRANVVLDLKPEGFQLKRFKEILERFTEAVQEHIASAFWEYVLLLELSYKLLRDDRARYLRDHELLQPYQTLELAFGGQIALASAREADFSERMLSLTRQISERLADMLDDDSSELTYLASAKVVELVYGDQIPQLRSALGQYLRNKEEIWILFDNIDKGWPTRGVTSVDILILRTLLDATRKIERAFSKRAQEIHAVIFVRNDVYELLVEESADRGKERRVSLDWTDKELLIELLRRRLVRCDSFDENETFESVWSQVACSHIDGSATSDYVLERSLMRPRNLINLVAQCIGNAVNLKHNRIEETDIYKACRTYSTDLAKDLSMEIRDVLPAAEDVLYAFIGGGSRLSLGQIRERIGAYIHVDDAGLARLVEILLWFGFIGVVTRDVASRPFFIYDALYEMKKLKVFAGFLKDENVQFEIHPAFWPFLEIAE